MKLNSKREIAGATFILAEKIDDYRSATMAQAEYWAEGFCCRREIIIPKNGRPHYNIWLGPERLRRVKLLPGEVIQRVKGTRIIRVA